MKKILYFLCACVLVTCMTGCFSKKLTTDTFKEKMESLNYTVQNGDVNLESSKEINELLIATKDQIEVKFYVFSNSGSALDFIETLNNSNIKRNDNTLVVINNSTSDQAQEIFKTLGY